MKRTNLSFALMGIAMLAMISCEPKNTPVNPDPQDTTQVPTDTTEHPTDTTAFVEKDFPKKHLIEEFTGQTCGYCPYGMDCISEFMANDTNWVLVLHHYGYAADHFSVAGSKVITTQLKVNGAPSMAINRAKTTYQGGSGIVYHPGYLTTVDKSQFDKRTYASIAIDNTYDASSRELKVHVSGLIGSKEYSNTLKLTVLVKESGMIDTQADYYYTFEGWQEFRHANAVRAFLTDAKGLVLNIDSATHLYAEDLSVTIDESWVADNCMVVAFLSEDFKPVVQAEQKPVVAGTQGGADITHCGITAVPVPDYYPEPNASDGPATYSNNKSEVVNNATGWYTPYSNYGFNYWSIQAYSVETGSLVTVNGVKCVPFAYIYLFTELSETAIPEGTYEFNTTKQPGTAYAGFRDDEQALIDGSQFYFTSYSYLQQGYLVPEAQWLIADGTLTIEADKWAINGHARNGAPIRIQGTGAIQNGGKNQAPQHKQTIQADRPVWEIAPRGLR